MLNESDITVDEEARAELITDALDLLSEEDFMLPLLQFPKSAAYRSDRSVDRSRISSTTTAPSTTFRSGKTSMVTDRSSSVPSSAPSCLNPLTECANSSWYVWAAESRRFRASGDTTNDAQYELTNLVAGEPVDRSPLILGSEKVTTSM